MTSPVAGQDHRVDFRQRSIGVPERAVQALQDLARLRQAGFRNADLARQVIRLAIREPLRRIDEHLVNPLGRVRRDFLDVHAAFGRGHHGDLLRAAVHHDADIKLLLDVGTFLDEQAPHLLPLGTGLVGLQLHAQDLARPVADLLDRPGELDAATLAAPAGMDLGLHHPHLAAELFCRFDRFIDREARNAAGRRHTEFPEDILRLVFMDFHLWPLFNRVCRDRPRSIRHVPRTGSPVRGQKNDRAKARQVYRKAPPDPCWGHADAASNASPNELLPRQSAAAR